MSASLPHSLDEHGQPDGPDIFARELERIVAHPGTRLDPLRDFRSSAHGQLHGRDPGPGYGNRKQGTVRRGMQIERPRGLVCATIALVLGAIARTSCRGFRNVSRRCRMPRFLYPSHAPLDPALVFFSQLGLADLKDLARPNPEFLDLFRHHRWHVHDPIAFERVQDLFAIASFDALAIVPAEGYFDWGVCIKSQNSIGHCCSPCSPCCSSSGGSNPSSGGSGKSSGGSSSSSCSSSGSSSISCLRSAAWMRMITPPPSPGA